ncbi:MAG: hypothetical protein NVSMB49_02270 [Ktedonobacteraceae bacterium]
MIIPKTTINTIVAIIINWLSVDSEATATMNPAVVINIVKNLDKFSFVMFTAHPFLHRL